MIPPGVSGRKLVAVVAAAGFVLACAACSSNAQTGSGGEALTSDAVKQISHTARQAGHVEQADALKDGRVTASEYRAAFERMRACVVDKGYEVSAPVVSPVTNTNFEFLFDSNGRDQQTAQIEETECEAKYWNDVSAVYIDTAPQQMSARLRQAIVDCLAGKGFRTPGGASTLPQIAGTDPERDDKRRMATMTCANKQVARLYPDLPTITLTF